MMMRCYLSQLAGPALSSFVPASAFSVSRSALIHTASPFAGIQEAPKDPILGVSEAFHKDKSPTKINLGVGAYRDNDGRPVVLQSVREAEKRVSGSHFMEYLPIGGSKEFVNESIKLAYGSGASAIKEGRIAGIQSLSGTGSCRLFADFQKRFMPDSKIYIPVPTWSNHHNIWADARVPASPYRYYKPSTRSLDFEGFMDDIRAAPTGSVFLLHACAHNPTGVDPSPEQWAQISKLMLEKQHFPFFDMAYQGFASGDCDRDALSVRMFLNDGHRLGCSQSYAKNMGLYGQRVGCFSIVTDNPKEASAVESQMKMIARPMYSNPPLHGALLVSTILHDTDLRTQWFGEVKTMADRIITMRSLLRNHLEEMGTPGTWAHVTDQIGMFAFTGITPEMVDALAAKHSIYMTRNGRISMAGVNTHNVERLAAALKDVIVSVKA